MNQTKLSYKQFQTELQRILYQLLPKGIILEIHPVLKNNSLHLDSLIIHQMGHHLSPNFYLQEYYQQYLSGKTIEELSEAMVLCWKTTLKQIGNSQLDMSLEHCQERIVYRLINAGKNQELLEEVPYIPFLDLAIVFYCLVHSNQDGIGSIRISNSLMESWGLDTQTLIRIAGENTPKIFPAKYQPISNLLEQIVFQTEETLCCQNAVSKQEPYVLTNSNGINGAAVWLYPGELEEIADFFQKNLYILPSSIHELLILADYGSFQESELLAMVRQVNEECVDAQEILSDNIYYYDRRKKGVCMISG